METRRVIAIGVEGEPLSAQTAHLSRWVPSGAHTGALVFGWSKRRETDTENALRAALEASPSDRKLAVKEIKVRVDDDWIELDWAAAFEGELQQIDRGDVLVDSSIAGIYERLFLFEETRVRGKHLHFLRAERKRPERLRGLTPDYVPIVGRGRELQRLEELVEQASVDQGQIAGIIGDAGIGKTRLLAEFKDGLTRRQTRCVEGAFSPHQSVPYEGFRHIVVGLVGSEIKTLSRWEMTDAETDFLRLFLEPNAKIERLAGMKEEEIRQGLFYAVRKLIHCAARSPLAIILEDLHWADPPSIQLLEYLLEGLEERRLLLVVVHRPDLEPTWHRRLNYNEIRLSPLREDEIDRFAGTLLGVDRVALGLRNDLFRLSLGNPLYVEEIIRQLKDAQGFEIETDDEGVKFAKSAGTGRPEISGTLHALIATRFDRLPQTHRTVLQWLTLFGSVFDADETAAFLKARDIENSGDLQKTLFTRSYLAEKSAFPKRLHCFTHDLIFEVIHQSMEIEDRKTHHTEIGQFLLARYGATPGATLDHTAQHFLDGIPSLQGIHTLLTAGREASGFHSFLRAHQYFLAAEQQWDALRPTFPSTDEIYEPLIRSSIAVGDLASIPTLFNKWVTAGIGDRPEAKGKFARLQLSFFYLKADYERAYEASQRALDQFNSKADLEELSAEMMNDRLHTLISLGRNKDALHEGLRAIHRYVDEKYRNVRILLWARLAFNVSTMGDPAHALEYLEKGRGLVLPDTPANIQVELYLRYMAIFSRLGRDADMIPILNRAVEIAREAGLRQLAETCQLNRAIAEMETGRYSAALEDFFDVQQQATELGDRTNEIRGIIGYADVLADAGATLAARKHWEENSNRLAVIEGTWQQGSVRAVYSSLLTIEGRSKEAASMRREAARIRKQIGHHASSASNVLHALGIEAWFGLAPMANVASEFDEIAKAHQTAAWIDFRYHLHATALLLASLGETPEYGLTPELNPSDCPIAWLRQFCYVARIKWLDSLKRFKEADELRKEYRIERERIAQNVPSEYRADFFNHPLYRVPDRKG